MGRLRRKHLIRHRTQRILIRSRIELAVAGRLLRAHVVRSAEGKAGLGYPGAACLGHGQRDAEVGDHRLAGLQQDVLRLQVAVNDALAMGVIQGVRQQGEQTNRLLDRQLHVRLTSRARRVSP